SLVIAVHDESGKDLPFASVTIDGASIPMTSGQAVRVDPGSHILHVRVDKYAEVDQRIVVREGERSRPIVVTLTSTSKVVTTPTPPSTTTSRPIHPLVWVFGTLSL